MRILVDLQSVQISGEENPDQNPLILFVKELIRQCGNNQIIISLNGYYRHSSLQIRTLLTDYLPDKCIRVWHPPDYIDEVSTKSPEFRWRLEVANLLRQASIEDLQPDILLVPGISRSFLQQGVLGIDNKPVLKTVLAFLDLNEINFERSDIEDHVNLCCNIENLSRADCFLVNSEMDVGRLQAMINAPLDHISCFALYDNPYEVEHKSRIHKLLDICANLPNRGQEKKELAVQPRRRLAYISPMPPERSGISDYSAQLLPELSKYYAIDVINNATVDTDKTGYSIKSDRWFLDHSYQYDRVLYHFGNSSFHAHMTNLLEQVPGVVVLHDFFLGHLLNFIEAEIAPHTLTRALYCSHGYLAVQERYRNNGTADAIMKFPANFEIIRLAKHLIVHSEYSRKLLRDWYGGNTVDCCSVIPLLRESRLNVPRSEARQKLDLPPDVLLVTCFGFMGETKLNHRLLESWESSSLSKTKSCRLVFVGEAPAEEYGTKIKLMMASDTEAANVGISGWVDNSRYHYYLAASDLAVQLRTSSRGETSAAVYDCLNYGIPTIVNANGSFAELPSDAVWMMPDKFSNEQLLNALETLKEDREKRYLLGKNAIAKIQDANAPKACAKRYFHIIEQAYANSDFYRLANAVASIKPHKPSDSECLSVAEAIARTLIPLNEQPQLLLDVTSIYHGNSQRLQQRAVVYLARELLSYQPKGFRVEPVYLSNTNGVWRYRYARQWTCKQLGLPGDWLDDEPVDHHDRDRLIIAGFNGEMAIQAFKAGLYESLKIDGVRIEFIVFDLLPLSMPEFFPSETTNFSCWLHCLSSIADGAFCFSLTIVDQLRSWIKNNGPTRLNELPIRQFCPGAEMGNSISTQQAARKAEKALSKTAGIPTFLMVDAIAPLNGYPQVLQAFTLLWRQGVKVNLFVAGEEGGRDLPSTRCDAIMETVKLIREHPQSGKRLFWVPDIGDDYLKKLYSASSCLIAAAEGDGFGLPLMEAARKQLPIFARDIPVYQELAGKKAVYFQGLDPDRLALALREWLMLKECGNLPDSSGITCLTWQQSAARLIAELELEEH